MYCKVSGLRYDINFSLTYYTVLLQSKAYKKLNKIVISTIFDKSKIYSHLFTCNFHFVLFEPKKLAWP